MADLARTPSTESLQSGLASIPSLSRPRVVHREAAVRESTHPSEVVTCELADGSRCRLLLKYSGFERQSFGHKGGVPYEGMVYRDVLSQVGLTSVRWFGNYQESDTGRTWMILQFIENARRLSKSRLPLSAGASWIGRFHRVAHPLPPPPGLIRYDTEYYANWSRLVWGRAERAQGANGWLRRVCDAFADLAAELAAWQPTIVHGEYYAKNILVIDGAVCPVDWESAAAGQGEVDLAALTEYWKPEAVRDCETAYADARWPEGAPAEFPRILELARMYIHLRWLAVVQHWPEERMSSRLLRLKDVADRMGLACR